MTAVNGLELKTPEAAGYRNETIQSGRSIIAVLFQNGIPVRGIDDDPEHGTVEIGKLVKLPAPKKYRPYRRGEVKLGDAFRHKDNGKDYMVIEVTDTAVHLGCNYATSYPLLLSCFDRLTLSPDGEECVSSAGVEE